MHGTSLSGVSFTRLSHCEELTAAAPVGTSRTATAQHSGTSHRSRNRDPLLTGMRASLSVVWCFRTALPHGSHDARREALARAHRIPPMCDLVRVRILRLTHARHAALTAFVSGCLHRRHR